MSSTRTAITRTAFAGAVTLLAAASAHAQPVQPVQSVPAAAFAATPAVPLALAPAAAAPVTLAPVPFVVGEEVTYEATFGGIPAGTARMRVDGIELVRGRPAYYVVFTIDGGVPFFRVHDRYDSWIDVATLASLRYRQQISEGRYKRTTTYEIYPERGEYRKNADSAQASVAHPLDDGSLLYAARVAGVRAGETRRDDRYFKPDRNPVVLTGVRQETVTLPAGTFATTVVRPSIRTVGVFAEDGDAEVWFSDDASRYPVQVRTKFSKFSIALRLQSVTRGVEPGAMAGLLAAATAP